MTVTTASDARLELLLAEATALIDRVTGWFFEPRSTTFRLDGRGTPSLELPVPPIRITQLALGGEDLSLAFEDLVVAGAPVPSGVQGPRLTLRHGQTFPRGHGNVAVAGRWGFTEEDGSPEGRTPLAIRRACLLLVLRSVAPLADEASFEARSRWRILEERTRDQSYRLDPQAKSARPLTGDPEVDGLLAPYVRPAPIGAA